jgi:hypothetical protein
VLVPHEVDPFNPLADGYLVDDEALAVSFKMTSARVLSSERALIGKERSSDIC